MNDVSPELLTLGITHDSSLALVLYLCWFIIMPEIMLTEVHWMMRIQTAFGRAMYRKRLLDMITELLHTFLKLFLHMYFGNYFLHLYFKYC